MLRPDVDHRFAGGDVMDLSYLDLDTPADVHEVLLGIWEAVTEVGKDQP